MVSVRHAIESYTGPWYYYLGSILKTIPLQDSLQSIAGMEIVPPLQLGLTSQFVKVIYRT